MSRGQDFPSCSALSCTEPQPTAHQNRTKILIFASPALPCDVILSCQSTEQDKTYRVRLFCRLGKDKPQNGETVLWSVLISDSNVCYSQVRVVYLSLSSCLIGLSSVGPNYNNKEIEPIDIRTMFIDKLKGATYRHYR